MECEIREVLAKIQDGKCAHFLRIQPISSNVNLGSDSRAFLFIILFIRTLQSDGLLSL
jgi:hypothetical protein